MPALEWLILPGMRLRDRLLQSNTVSLVTFPGYFLPFAANMLFLDEGSLWWVVAVGVSIALWIATVWAGLAIVRRMIRAPEVSADGVRMRRGSRETLATAITQIRAGRLRTRRGELLLVTISGRGAPQMTVILRDGETALSPHQTEAFARFLSSTGAVIPKDRWDPRGRMSRITNPGLLTPDEAAGLVRDPRSADSLVPAAARGANATGRER